MFKHETATGPLSLHNERTEQPGNRPLPLRTRTECSPTRKPPSRDGQPHPRNKSTFPVGEFRRIDPPREIDETSGSSPPHYRAEDTPLIGLGLISPPATPSQIHVANIVEDVPDIAVYDFTKLDYELERARTIGTGLWSAVFLADAFRNSTPSPPLRHHQVPLTPPWEPSVKSPSGSPSLFAVKTPARPDSKEVFRQEARILSHLTRQPLCDQYVVGFHGLDKRNGSLVFEAVLGGSLDNLNSRLQQMTEVARHVELISIFPRLACDLVNGLAFLHGAGVVHADIKPANILLDIYVPEQDDSNPSESSRPVIRARYIDFSASFRPSRASDSQSQAGGTWDYMAPEQMRITDRALSTPSPASDIWSLGITLLYVIVGASPYAAACQGNNFLLREAIKAGDPISFAKTEPRSQKRMAACQDFVDCCRRALHKDRERRGSAGAWSEWLRVWESELGT